MPVERGQLLLFETDEKPSLNAILRMEVYQPPGADVSRVTIFMFDEPSGEELDSWLVYAAGVELLEDNVFDLSRPPDNDSVGKQDKDDEAFEFVDDEADSNEET